MSGEPEKKSGSPSAGDSGKLKMPPVIKPAAKNESARRQEKQTYTTTERIVKLMDMLQTATDRHANEIAVKEDTIERKDNEIVVLNKSLRHEMEQRVALERNLAKFEEKSSKIKQYTVSGILYAGIGAVMLGCWSAATWTPYLPAVILSIGIFSCCVGMHFTVAAAVSS